MYLMTIVRAAKGAFKLDEFLSDFHVVDYITYIYTRISKKRQEPNKNS